MTLKKHKKRKGKKSTPTVSGPFAGTYWHLRRLAETRRLFVLFDGDPAAPRLTFFDAIRGMALLDYWPKSRVWSYSNRAGRGGGCRQHDDIIAVAVGRAGQRSKADKSQFGMPA